MRRLYGVFLVALAALFGVTASADVLLLETFGFAGGKVLRLDELTGEVVPGWEYSPSTVNPAIGQLSGLTVHAGVGYVSSLDTGQVFHFDVATGAAIGDGVFASLPPLDPNDPRLIENPEAVASPSALAVGADGMLYVGDNGGESVLRFNLANGAFVNRVVEGLTGVGSVGFSSDGVLLTTDGVIGVPASVYAGSGNSPAVLYDSSFSQLTSANGLLPLDDESFLIADLFSNSVFKFANDGTSLAPFPQLVFIPHPDDFDPENPPAGAIELAPGFFSTFPTDVDLDAEGNILVTSLGVSSVVQGSSENYGSILRYAPDGSLIERVADDLYAPSAIELVSGYVNAIGDYNRDGTLDFGDYEVWRAGYGAQVSSYSNADGNGDGVIDAADYTIWRDNLGTAMLSSTAAPEPVAWALGLAAWGMLGAVRRR